MSTATQDIVKNEVRPTNLEELLASGVLNVTAIGRLVSDPVTKQVGDKTVANTRIAISRRYTDGQGVVRETVVFANLEAWGGSATVLAKYGKGDPVEVKGRVKITEYVGKDDNEIHHSTVFTAYFITTPAWATNSAPAGEEI